MRPRTSYRALVRRNQVRRNQERNDMSCKCSSAPQQSCAPGTSGLERVNYFPRQIMTVEDMITEAEYFREKLRRHNRYLHGWGVVCGLDVAAAPTSTAPATVSISGGYAIGPFRDE